MQGCCFFYARLISNSRRRQCVQSTLTSGPCHWSSASWLWCQTRKDGKHSSALLPKHNCTVLDWVGACFKKGLWGLSHLKHDSGQGLCGYPGAPQRHMGVLDQIRSELSLETKKNDNTVLSLSYFGHITGRQDKAVMLGKVETEK